ncbi:sensor histidine kinase [Actinopolymorpha pittospori]|uniref:histidine kinase n=1 Tax=Actinopolymorpha pittospori TaxID=648752 RepID=A0A927MTF2_9ACTN|nr:histidine kinase [Actinopolymorpha pittospori]MBE1604498.1 signal transduction histidine kinase [Actinopolymorpha pittospori]
MDPARRVAAWMAGVVVGAYRSLVLTVLFFALPAVVAVLGVWSFRIAQNPVLAAWWTVVGAFVLFVVGGRPLCWTFRVLVRRWCGVEIATLYRPMLSPRRMSTGYWWNGYGYNRWRRSSVVQRWLRSRTRDPASWRDMVWLVVAPFTVGVVVVLPLASIGVVASVWESGGQRWWALLPLFVGVVSAPYGWRAVGPVAVAVLGSPRSARLAERVQDLVATQADMTATQAAEIRRIERDLHDGAQARLVALGMTLSAAERALRSDPGRAQQLLAEARTSTTAAVAELRELVRGITAPILIERGLVDAIRAMAMDIPLPIQVRSTIKDRLELPAESALYFGVAELLANIVKHAQACSVTITADYAAGAARIAVSDDGVGGAAVLERGGLRGLEHRLAPFGGTLRISSPAGGPTTATMVVPCAYS